MKSRFYAVFCVVWAIVLLGPAQGLASGGEVGAWGDNSEGQAYPPPGLSGVKAVAAGGFHSLALRVDGTVVGWGNNTLGQAQPPPGLRRVTAIAAGVQHNLALKEDHTVVAWGYNGSGQSTVPGGLWATAIAAGFEHSLVVADFESLDRYHVFMPIVGH